MHLLDASDLDDVGARAAHVRAHHIQKVGNVNNVGLFGHVFQHGLALGHHSRQHGVDGGAHRNGIEKHVLAAQAVGLHTDHTVFHRVLRAEGYKRLEVLVDGARAEITAAGHGHGGFAETAQQRAQKIIRGAHLARKLVGHTCGGDMGCVDLQRVLVDDAHMRAHGAEDVHRGTDVADIGQVLDHTFTACKNGGRQDGDRRIFRAADLDFAHQRFTAVNDKLFQ